MFIVLMTVGGVLSFFQLGQLEDPEFTIKTAMIVTSYPGASPQQVEEEVTYPLENAIQQLGAVDYVSSISSAGLSQISVEMKNTYRKTELRQIWDELRRKVNDLTSMLPPGVENPLVLDDFGDVYGVTLAITGQGYSYEELQDYVDFLRRELVLVDGVGKVVVSGEQQQQVVVELSTLKLASLGISAQRIYQLLQSQNVVSNAGNVKVGGENIRLYPTGEFKDVSELANLLISNDDTGELVYLGDVAKIFKSVAEVPTHLIRYDSQPALALGISFATGVNVVDVNKLIEGRVLELERDRPIGIEINEVYNQPIEVEKSVSGFLLSLLEAVAIVVVVLLFFMGVRSGLLIGATLLLTVLGTFIFMNYLNIDLQRISLGALIIALGMLVDNAIVVTEGILIGMQKGKTRLKAAVDIVGQTKWPLLGATIIGVTAFAPIGLSSDATGEFAGSLFYVLLVSLMLSWVTAITLVPFFAGILFQDIQNSPDSASLKQDEDPYKGIVFTLYKKLLVVCLEYRKTTVTLLVIMLAVSVFNFSKIKESFFPVSGTPVFFVDYWRYQGSDIRQTETDIKALEKFILKSKVVAGVTTTVGQGAPRFMLTYNPEKSYAAYAQLIVRTDGLEHIEAAMSDVRKFGHEYMMNAQLKLRRIEVGPTTDSKIEARFTGPDPLVLRQLAKQAEVQLSLDHNIHSLTNNWRQQVKVVRPRLNELQARRLGVSKSDIDEALLTNFDGSTVGLYREGTSILPIVVRSPESERLRIDAINDLQIYSPSKGVYLPISQIVQDFEITWEDSLIHRRDRKRTITVMADHDVLGEETAAKVFARVKQGIEDIPLPEGYEFEWGGEYESSSDAQSAIFGSLPLGLVVMFAITVLLFNSIKKPLIIWATVPLSIVGVFIGLMVTNSPFSFMALLGLLSLSGMLIKNGIVLIDQINIELKSNKSVYQAIFDSAVSRFRPVTMAAVTTILGMIPLLFDVFFKSMAVTIMFGLAFATVLTLLVIPVLFLMTYKASKQYDYNSQKYL